MESFVGGPFVLVASPIIALSAMMFWYWLKPNEETARALSAITILAAGPLVAIVTLEWRWGEIGDHPASGIPFFVALIESFGIWCCSLVAIFVLHAPLAKFAQKRRARKEMDPDIFE